MNEPEAITDQGGLAPQERRAVVYGPLLRILGTPVVAALGLVNTAIIVRQTGEAVFGLVSLVATVTLLFPFADLGIGATVLSASSKLTGPTPDTTAVDVIRRGYHVLFAVAGMLILVALAVMGLNGWGAIIGFSSGTDDRWAITVAACIFALTIPGGLGVRILIGIDRNPLATLVTMSCPAFGLGLTMGLFEIDANGIWYAVPPLGGLLLGGIVGTALALRLSGLRWTAFAPVSSSSDKPRLLTGSGWLFLVGVGLAVGLQAGRLLLAWLSTPVELSKYALMAQIYGVCWSILSTAGLAYWPVFVRRRESNAETLRIWWRLTAGFAAIAAIAAVGMTLFGPWAASVLSGGEIAPSASLALAFGVLLVGQGMRMPATVLLTRPTEARWQALWTLTMAAISIGLGYAAAGSFGAIGVVCAAAAGVFAAQVIPDLLWTPRLVARRPRAGE